MIDWKDTSSWSQGERDRTPKTWTAQVGKFQLTVHRHIHYEPDQWLATCNPDLFRCVELASKDIEQAKCQAVAKLQSICEEALRVILSR